MTDTPSLSPRIVIVGAVAGGASAAARARRLDENADITLIERGPDVSFANCGLPYHIGGEITDRSKLALQTPDSLRKLLNLKVLAETEAVAAALNPDTALGESLPAADAAGPETRCCRQPQTLQRVGMGKKYVATADGDFG